jgi:hypothetical protein
MLLIDWFSNSIQKFLLMLKYLVFLTILSSAASCQDEQLINQNERPIKSLFDKQDDARDKYFMVLPKERKAYWFNKYVKEVGVDTLSGQTMEDVENAIHFADLNHDTFPDIIDESNLGIAPLLVYLTYQDSFRQIIDDGLSRLKGIRYLGNKTELITRTLGMIDYFQGESLYVLESDSIHLVKYRTRRLCTTPPQTYFKAPLSIQTLESETPLRENPRITIGECFMEDGKQAHNLSDNILERFKKRSHGLAWGESHDTNGQKWLLIEILSANYPEYCGYRVGWMKATDVVEID